MILPTPTMRPRCRLAVAAVVVVIVVVGAAAEAATAPGRDDSGVGGGPPSAHLAAPRGPMLTVEPVAGSDPDEVLRVTDAVLAQPEYGRSQPGLLARLGEHARRLIATVLTRLAAAGGPAIALAVIAAVALVVAVVAWRVTMRLSPDRAVTDAAAGAEAAWSSGDWDARADANERQERWRDAVRCRFAAAVAGLAEQGLLDTAPGRTVGEHRRTLTRTAPPLAAAFDAAARDFEAVWYGYARADAGTAGRLRQQRDRLRLATR